MVRANSRFSHFFFAKRAPKRIVFTARCELNLLLIFVFKVLNMSKVNMYWNMHCGRGKCPRVCVNSVLFMYVKCEMICVTYVITAACYRRHVCLYYGYINVIFK